MQLIIPHRVPDLDALGAALGVRVLYPQARVVLQGNVGTGAAEFASLHRYQIDAISPRDVKPDEVSLAVIVDTQDPERTGVLAPLLQRPGLRLHIYDHHPREAGDLEGELVVLDSVGATSTLVTELLTEAGARIEPYTATALLLGIYADTGNLTLPTTTPRDVHAAAWLLESGASLRAVAAFLSVDLTPAQQELLLQLQGGWGLHQAGRLRVGIATGQTGSYVDGLSHIISHLQEVRPAPATFLAVEMTGRVHLVGRSEVPWLDVARVLTRFGGGGHAGAASAVVRGKAPAELVAPLLAAVAESAGSPVTATDLMQTPVRVVPESLAVARAHRLMLRYGHSGLPVVDAAGQLRGVISRRDTEKALRSGLGRIPVKGFMSRPAITVPPDADLDEIQRLMLEKDIGRVPVLAQGQMLGIVSRTDVLGQLYGGLPPRRHQPLSTSGTVRVERRRLVASHLDGVPESIRTALAAAGAVARDLALPAYAVGGFVRDLLLGRPNLDLDIVVEGDGVVFAEALGARFGARVEKVVRFGTAHVYVSQALRVDVATARREFYELPAALPQVEQADLRADLARRDFTINAMAFRLSPEGPGPLLDFFGGHDDLRAGRVRVLHSLSFVEDPTRVLRAARLASRYLFRLEPGTEDLVREALRSGVLERVSGERLAAELMEILKEDTAAAALALLADLDALSRMLPDLLWTAAARGLLAACSQLVLEQLGPLGLGSQVQPWLLRAVALCQVAGVEHGPKVLSRLRLPRAPREQILRVLSEWDVAWAQLAKAAGRPAEVTAALREWPPEGVALLWLAAEHVAHSEVAQRVATFWQEYRLVRPSVTGRDLKAMGIPPGPDYSQLLAQVLDARLDGTVQTFAEEVEFVQALARRPAPENTAHMPPDTGGEEA